MERARGSESVGLEGFGTMTSNSEDYSEDSELKCLKIVSSNLTNFLWLLVIVRNILVESKC